MSNKNLVIAQTIMDQLGGPMFRVMTGAKNVMYLSEGSQYEGGVTFTIGSGAKCDGVTVGRVTVKLAWNDTYTVEFLTSRGRVIKSEEEIYCDMLRDCFTRNTGFYTSMRG